jgi:hypothetical protein
MDPICSLRLLAFILDTLSLHLYALLVSEFRVSSPFQLLLHGREMLRRIDASRGVRGPMPPSFLT